MRWFIFRIESFPVSKTARLLVFLHILYVTVNYSSKNIHHKPQDVEGVELHPAEGEEAQDGLDD